MKNVSNVTAQKPLFNFILKTSNWSARLHLYANDQIPRAASKGRHGHSHYTSTLCNSEMDFH